MQYILSFCDFRTIMCIKGVDRECKNASKLGKRVRRLNRPNFLFFNSYDEDESHHSSNAQYRKYMVSAKK